MADEQSPGAPSPETLRAWSAPFGIAGDPNGLQHEVPARILRVTETAWQALSGRATAASDQFAPGLSGLGAALVARNLALTLPDRPPLIVYSTAADLTRAYHQISYKLLGRWAIRYPMYFRGSDGLPTPLNKRGLPRTNLPRPLVYRAFNDEDLSHWLSKVPGARVFIFADGPSAAPDGRPERSHVVLRGVLARDRDHARRIRPCALALPERPPARPPEKTRGTALALFNSEANVAGFACALEGVPVQDPDLERLSDLYRVLCREPWTTWGPFLNLARSVNVRLQADAFTGAATPAPDAGVTTDAQLTLLDALLRVGQAPPRAEAHEFVGTARRAYERRKSFASGKATWLSNHIEALEGDEAPALVLDPYNAARGKKLLPRSKKGGRRPRVLPYSEVEATKTGRVVVAAAPNARLLERIATGGASDATLLLYPWEGRVYNAARLHLMRSAQAVGVTAWPGLPAAPYLEETSLPDRAVLVARPLVGPAAAPEPGDEEDEEREELPPPPGLDDPDLPRVRVWTDRGRHEFPSERIVIARRDDAFHEMQAGALQHGDVLVAPTGGGNPSAHEVIARICKKNALMSETRVAAASWRQLLREYVARHHKGTTVADVHRALNLRVSYFQFRFWLKEDEPIAPRRENLLELLKSIGYGPDLADLIDRAARTHRSHRRAIYGHLLNLARSRLDEIFHETSGREEADPQYTITIEDLMSAVQFENVQKKEELHAAAP